MGARHRQVLACVDAELTSALRTRSTGCPGPWPRQPWLRV